MISYIWPMALVVVANTLYQICAKSVPGGMNPFASLTVTYVVGAVASGIFYVALGNGGSLWQEYAKLNWAPFVLGLVIVGWPVSTAFILQSAVLAVLLLAVGWALYREPITPHKLMGVGICLVGLYVLSRQ